MVSEAMPTGSARTFYCLALALKWYNTASFLDRHECSDANLLDNTLTKPFGILLHVPTVASAYTMCES